MRLNSVYQTVQLMSAVAIAAPANAAPQGVQPKVWAHQEHAQAGRGNSTYSAVPQVLGAGGTEALRSVRAQFAALNALQDGWDGPTSLAPDKHVRATAARILNAALSHHPHVPAPVIVPTASGGLQAEWYTVDHRLEVYFDPDGEISSWSEARKSGVEMEEEGRAAIQLLADWTAAREIDALVGA